MIDNLFASFASSLANFPDALSWVFSRVFAKLDDPVFLRDIAKTGSVLTIVVLLEIAARKQWRVRYGSRNFRVDVLYFVFYYSGLYHFLIFAWMYRELTELVRVYAPWLQMNLLSGLSEPLQVVIVIFMFDLIGYWSHRWRHANRYLWVFHAVHHSQTTLTPMSTYRHHFIDETILRLCVFIPFQIMGTGVVMWLWIDFLMAWLTLIVHSEWNWNYGRFGRIFVSPVFHRLHHSTDMTHQNHNFAGLFSFWDDLFRTAERRAPPPKKHGLEGNPITETFISQLFAPFSLLAAELRTRPKTAAAASPVRHPD